jgi:hypothetical protein
MAALLFMTVSSIDHASSHILLAEEKDSDGGTPG